MPGSSPPIHRVPPEILAHIFQDFYSTEDEILGHHAWDNANDNAILKRTITPYSVSSVCKYWDEASTLVPEMWKHTRILISLDGREGGSPAQVTERYLQRAPHGDPFVVHIMCERGREGDPRVYERQRVIDLLPVLSIHLHHISELFILTRFKVTVDTYETDTPRDSPSLSWPTEPSIQHIPELQRVNLSGPTFISYCRAVNLFCHSILEIQNISSNSSDAFCLEELLTFFTRIAPKAELHLLDVDLRALYSESTSEIVESPSAQQSPCFIKFMELSCVNADTVNALLLLCSKGVYSPRTISIHNCSLLSPINITPMTLHKLMVNDFDVSSIINILDVVDPKDEMVIKPDCNIGNGYVETRFAGHRQEGVAPSSLQKLMIQPLEAYWQQMTVNASDRWVTQRYDLGTREINIDKVNAWEIDVENCNVSCYFDHRDPSVIFVEFIRIAVDS
ncbi:hypothetical protein BKA70DRAFT_1342257, partial [Coprinopsis sp. MPI-PUGE-AT-0042]